MWLNILWGKILRFLFSCWSSGETSANQYLDWQMWWQGKTLYCFLFTINNTVYYIISLVNVWFMLKHPTKWVVWHQTWHKNMYSAGNGDFADLMNFSWGWIVDFSPNKHRMVSQRIWDGNHAHRGTNCWLSLSLHKSGQNSNLSKNHSDLWSSINNDIPSAS